MKIIAWHDNYPARTKDAQDLLFLMKEYLNAGNQERLYDTAADILSTVGFSLEVAGPRLLGRDIRRIVHVDTRDKLLEILTRETAEDSQFRLLSDMTRTTLRDDTRLEAILLLLRQLKAGLAHI
jgi:predicted nucleotidyltransferase